MTRHMYRSLLYSALLKVDPRNLLSALLDHQKAQSIYVNNRTIDTDEALEMIVSDLGLAIVVHEDKLILIESNEKSTL